MFKAPFCPTESHGPRASDAFVSSDCGWLRTLRVAHRSEIRKPKGMSRFPNANTNNGVNHGFKVLRNEFRPTPQNRDSDPPQKKKGCPFGFPVDYWWSLPPKSNAPHQNRRNGVCNSSWSQVSSSKGLFPPVLGLLTPPRIPL